MGLGKKLKRAVSRVQAAVPLPAVPLPVPALPPAIKSALPAVPLPAPVASVVDKVQAVAAPITRPVQTAFSAVQDKQAALVQTVGAQTKAVAERADAVAAPVLKPVETVANKASGALASAGAYASPVLQGAGRQVQAPLKAAASAALDKAKEQVTPARVSQAVNNASGKFFDTFNSVAGSIPVVGPILKETANAGDWQGKVKDQLQEAATKRLADLEDQAATPGAYGTAPQVSTSAGGAPVGGALPDTSTEAAAAGAYQAPGLKGWMIGVAVAAVAAVAYFVAKGKK